MECFECGYEYDLDTETIYANCPSCGESLCEDCAPIHISAHDDQTRSDIENGAFDNERR